MDKDKGKGVGEGRIWREVSCCDEACRKLKCMSGVGWAREQLG